MVIGGAKVADKLGVLTELVAVADKVIVGGRMAFTFLAQQGVALGRTHVEHDLAQQAASIIRLAETNVRSPSALHRTGLRPATTRTTHLQFHALTPCKIKGYRPCTIKELVGPVTTGAATTEVPVVSAQRDLQYSACTNTLSLSIRSTCTEHAK